MSSLCIIQLWCVIFLHPFLSEAILFILSIVIPLRFILSSASSMYTSLSLFLGRPLDRFPCLGFQSSKYWGNRSSGILLTCPNQRSRMLPIISANDVIGALFKTSSFLTLYSLWHFENMPRSWRAMMFDEVNVYGDLWTIEALKVGQVKQLSHSKTRIGVSGVSQLVDS